MKRTNLIVVTIAALLILGAGAFALTKHSSSSTNSDSTMTSMPSTSSSGTAPVASNTITIKDYLFSPASITVRKGTKVTWTNHDSVKHSIVSDDGMGPGSELLAKNESYSYTFDTVGTFSYHCGPHPYMKAKVTVTE